jgi:hypothetical protein
MFARALIGIVLIPSIGLADDPKALPPSADHILQALDKAQGNRKELEKALAEVPTAEKAGMEFLIANMPDRDLTTLTAEFLLTNTKLAYAARKEVPWGNDIPEAIFLNDVLAYANVDEKRDAWRKEFYDLCMPIAKQCKTPSEAAQRLNSELFKTLKLGYSTQRKAPNQSPKESIEQGKASCTGLSIVLSDACRSVCVPARLVGTAMWANKRGNHTWVEIWDKDWHFTGACEPDPKGLNRGWFVGDAAQAKKDVREHAIFATSFRKTNQSFPLVWARNSKTVPAENVTDRYAKPALKTTVPVYVRVKDFANRRIVVMVTVSEGDKVLKDGKSNGESADTNDFLTFELEPNREYTIRSGTAEKKIKTGEAGKPITVNLVREIDEAKRTVPDANQSADALKELKTALTSSTLSDLLAKPFASVPLTKADAASARATIWDVHVTRIKSERAKEHEAKLLKENSLEMPYFTKTFGEKPKSGHSLWISMHGGGNTTPRANDRQWENQKKLYTLEEGIYVAPRAPTNTWNLWHEPHIDRLFTRLIENFIAIEGIDPDRVYITGYSAGGDGVYQLAPRMADQLAGAAMMAGHPNGVSLLSLRNLPFALQVGGNDAAYNRNKVAKEYGEQLDKLQKGDPEGYTHFVKIYEGKGHWMDREDKVALPWLAKYKRNPTPEKIVWKQTGTPHARFYWLAVPPNEAKKDTLVVAERKSQTIRISAEGVRNVLLRLNDEMADLDLPIHIVSQGSGSTDFPKRTIGTMIKTLLERGDPKQMFDAEISFDLGLIK